MNLTSWGYRLLEQARSNLYTGTLRRLIRQLGINNYLFVPYWRLMFSLANNRRAYSIADQNVSFYTETFDEFMRFRNLMGERPVLENLLRSLSPEDVFYDIGANVGTYTCVAASKLESDAVVAFEPERKNATRIEDNLELNHQQAQIVRIALSDRNGTTQLALAEGDTGEGEHAIATDKAETTIEVETARVDTIVREQEVPPPTAVKIDVEGAELSVLRGMEETLREHCRLVYVEVHASKIEEHGGSEEEVHSALEDAGFECEEIERRGDQYFIKGTK